jgi:hypothetical protein
MITLGVAELILIASRTLGLDAGEVLDLLDPAAAGQALAQAEPGSDPAGPAACAAALLHALVRERPLRRGNQRVALAAMLQFLALNGWDMNPDPPGPVAIVVAELAADRLDAKTLADWLGPRLRPSGHAVTPVKEPPMRRMTRIKPRRMFQRFTDRARRAVYLAEQEARRLRQPHIGPEHLLLGLLEEGAGVAARVLASLGASLEDVRGRVEEISGHGQGTPSGHIPLTAQARKVLDLSAEEALALGHHYIGTEHLLLSLLQGGEGESVAVQVLAGLGADRALVRDRVTGLLREHQRAGGTGPDGGAARTA